MRYQAPVNGSSQAKVVAPVSRAQVVQPAFLITNEVRIQPTPAYLESTGVTIHPAPSLKTPLVGSLTATLAGRGLGMSCGHFAALDRDNGLAAIERAVREEIHFQFGSYHFDLDENRFRRWLQYQYDTIMAICAHPTQQPATAQPVTPEYAQPVVPWSIYYRHTPFAESTDKGEVYNPDTYQTTYGGNQGTAPGKEALRPAGQASTPIDTLWSVARFAGTVGGIWFLASKLAR